MSELKPCPFCGGEAAKDDVGMLRPLYMVGCNNSHCHVDANIHSLNSYDECVAAWNTRTPEPAPQDNAEIVERVAKALSHTHLNFYEEPLGMNATRDDLERLALAAIRALATPIQK